jgi:tripartite-type tricarboxylate transporter receptor subunit TctC
MRNSCFAAYAALMIAAFGLTPAHSQAYPTRPIKLVQPSSAGGLSDTISRLIAKGMTKYFGQTVFVENKPGAMDIIANRMVSRADPDGYTILYGGINTTMAPYLRKEAVGFSSTKDLTPIAMATNFAGVFVATPNMPVKTLADLPAYAAAHPNNVRIANNGTGGSLDITARLFELKTGTHLTHIPYRGTTEAMRGIIAGEVELGTFGLPTGVSFRSKVRVLAQTGKTRHPLLPDVPTTSELGMDGVGITYWFGLYAPPRTPDAIVASLAKALEATTNDSAYRKKLENLGAVAEYLPPEAFTERIKVEDQRWRELLPKMGLGPE